MNVLTLGGDKKRPDMRPGSGVDISMLSFNRSCYLRTIHLVNRSTSTLARSLNIGHFKNNGLSQHSQCIFWPFLFKSGLFDFRFQDTKMKIEIQGWTEMTKGLFLFCFFIF